MDWDENILSVGVSQHEKFFRNKHNLFGDDDEVEYLDFLLIPE